MAEEVLGMKLVDDTDPCHDAGSVGRAESFAYVDPHRGKSAFLEYLGSRAPLTLIVDLTFSDKTEGDVRQLHQVATGANGAVFGNEGIDTTVDELGKKLDRVGMDAALGLDKRAYPCQHSSTNEDVVKRLACSGGVRTDDIVLEVSEVGVIHSPLGHRSETCVDAIDDFVACKVRQEVVARSYGFHGLVRYVQLRIPKENVAHKSNVDFHKFSLRLQSYCFFFNYARKKVFFCKKDAGV